jgi:hypothetical protein
MNSVCSENYTKHKYAQRAKSNFQIYVAFLTVKAVAHMRFLFVSFHWKLFLEVWTTSFSGLRLVKGAQKHMECV